MKAKFKFSFRTLFGSRKTRSLSRSSPSSSSSSLSPSEAPQSVLFRSYCSDCSHAYDGKISRQELELLFHRLDLEPPTEEELQLMLAEAAGLDGDGCISLEELGSAGGSELCEAFGYFDSDGDGRISAEELLRVFLVLGDERCTLEDCRRMIVGVDGGEKGFVCFEDFARMMGRRSCMI